MNEYIVENVKVLGNGEICGKVKVGGERADPRYEQMSQQLQQLFLNDQTMIVSSLAYGDLCAAFYGNNWYRARLLRKSSMARTGCIASCLLVDEGIEVTIHVNSVRFLPEKFLSLPLQVRTFHLHGVQPLSLQVSPEDLHTFLGPHRIWDEAAIRYIERNIKAAKRVRCTVMEELENGTVSVRVYLENSRGGLVCLNELLVHNKYATELAADTDVRSDTPPAVESVTETIQKVFRKRYSSNEQYLTKPDSDTEYRGVDRSGSEDSSAEQGYLSDTRGITTVSHATVHRLRNNKINEKHHHTFMDTEEKPYADQTVSERMEARRKAILSRHLKKSDNYSLFLNGTVVTSSNQPAKLSPSNNANICKFTSAQSSDSYTEVVSPSYGRGSVLGNDLSPGHGRGNLLQKSGSPSRGRGILSENLSSPSRGRGSLFKNFVSSSQSRSEISENLSSPPNVRECVLENSLSPSHRSQELVHQRGHELVHEPGEKLVQERGQKLEQEKVLPISCGRGALLNAVLQKKSNLSDLQLSHSPNRPVQSEPVVGKMQHPADCIGKPQFQDSSDTDCAESRREQLTANRYTRDIYSRLQTDSDFKYKTDGAQNYSESQYKANSVQNESDFSFKTDISRNERRRMAKSNPEIISNKERSVPENHSGYMSSDSDISIVAASVRGQAEFRSARLPKCSYRGDASERSDSEDGLRLITSSSHTKMSSSLYSSTNPDQSGDRNKPVRDTDRGTRQEPDGSSPSKLSPLLEHRNLSCSPNSLPPSLMSKDNPLKNLIESSDTQNGLYSSRIKPGPVSDDVSENVSCVTQSSHVTQSSQSRPVQASRQLPQDTCSNASREIRSLNRLEELGATSTEKSKLIGEMTGRRFLTELQQAAVGARSKKRNMSHRDDRFEFQTECNAVLVHGRKTPRPVYDVHTARFSEHIELTLIAWGIQEGSLYLSQAFSWPAITRGQHVVCVAPPGSGKTLAYLCPIVTALSDFTVYHHVRRNGNGPYVIILSFTWKRVEKVYRETVDLIGDRQDLKVMLLHGGAKLEDKKACELLNGLDILIITPPCLSRILKAGYTDLRRLCHLVIDDADQTLTSFRNDVGDLIENYHLTMKNTMKDLECPHQIMVFGAKWNQAIRAFMISNLNEPVLIITSPYEAAIYGQVQQEIHMCGKNERWRTLLGILDQIPEDTNRPVIVFASDTEDCIQLNKMLKTSLRMCLMVHKEMNVFEVERIAQLWPTPLLVVEDIHTSKLNITDATTVIHYDIPPTRTQFSNRLGCMRTFFYNFSKSQQSGVRPTSHIILTEDSRTQLPHICELLQRCDVEQPETLKAFLAGILHVRDEDEGIPLCPQLLAFGICRDLTRCKFRHNIILSVDHKKESDWLPSEGEVQVMLTNVCDASRYYVRMLKCKTKDGRMVDLSEKYVEMQIELATWYKHPKHMKRYTPPSSGYQLLEICGYEENEMFHRVQILLVTLIGDPAGAISPNNFMVKVKFVDSGHLKEITANKLLDLPQHFQELPFQAVEVYVCNVRPVDKDTDWTNAANIFIHESLGGQLLVGNVMLRLGSVLWLDPLLLRKVLPISKTVSHQFYVHEELVRNGFADDNIDHLRRLCKLCEGKIEVPKALLAKSRMSRWLDTESLSLNSQEYKVHVSSVNSPDLFFVQKSEKSKELESLMLEINDFVDKNDEYINLGLGLTPGKYCLAKYTSFDDRWYRGQILSITDNNYKVFFADYGDSDVVPKDCIRELPNDRFYELPLQAIECKLADVKPNGERWDEHVGDVFWDLTHCADQDLKLCTAVIQGFEQAQYAGRYKFVVELRTRTSTGSINIANEMVWLHFAVPRDDCGIQELFPRTLKLKKKMYKSSVDRVLDMCAMLYWEQDEHEELKLAREICQVLSSTLDGCGDHLRTGIVEYAACMVKLIGHLRSTAAQKAILDGLVTIAEDAPSFCEELINKGIVSSIAVCLERNSNEELQCQAARFISNAPASLNLQFRHEKNLQVLCELLTSTESDVVQGCVCRALAAMCSRSERVYDYLKEKCLVPKLTKYLLAASDHSVSEGILELISAFAEHDSEELMKESLLDAILQNLNTVHCDKCVQISVQQCESFSRRRKHKTFLLEHHVVSILKRLLKLEMQSTTRQMCQDLMTSLVVIVPSESLSASQMYRVDEHTTSASSNSEVSPDVLWTQNTYRVVMKVVVHNVSGSPENVVKFTNKSVQFRATVDGVCYAFKYRLFDEIIVDNSTVQITPGQVAISLKKQNAGMWNRLMHDKVKLPTLSLDYQNLVDSDSDTEVCDDDQPFLLARKKRRGLITDGAPAVGSKVEVDAYNSGTDTSDSLENEEDRDEAQIEDFL